MSQHTKEPWFAEENSQFWVIRHTDSDGCETIGDVCASKFIEVGDVGKPNADRIVACVNACAGINPSAVPMMMAALLKTVDYLNLRADQESSDLWQEVAKAVWTARGEAE